MPAAGTPGRIGPRWNPQNARMGMGLGKMPSRSGFSEISVAGQHLGQHSEGYAEPLAEFLTQHFSRMLNSWVRAALEQSV